MKILLLLLLLLNDACAWMNIIIKKLLKIIPLFSVSVYVYVVVVVVVIVSLFFFFSSSLFFLWRDVLPPPPRWTWKKNRLYLITSTYSVIYVSLHLERDCSRYIRCFIFVQRILRLPSNGSCNANIVGPPSKDVNQSCKAKQSTNTSLYVYRGDRCKIFQSV